MNPITVTIDGHTLGGTPDAIAAILTALPNGSARVERTESKPATAVRSASPIGQRKPTRRKPTRRKPIVPALPEATDTYLRTLYRFGPEVPFTGRGALIAAHLLDGGAHTGTEISKTCGVHLQTFAHTVTRLRQGGCQIEVDGVPMKRTKVRLGAKATVRVVRVGTLAQARNARDRYATGSDAQAKVPAATV